MPTSASTSFFLPRNVLVVRRLHERGVSVDPAPDEAPEAHHARIETALMALFRDTGGEAEFEALYDYTRSMVFGWILGLSRGSGQRAEPLDYLQDTYVNLYRYAAGFRDEHRRSFRGWARTIATNVVRRAQMRLRPSLQALPEGLQEPADQRPTPDRVALSAEQQRSWSRAWVVVLLEYAEAWEQLSPRDRKALDLVEVQGLSYAEASRRLCVGISNMKMIMFRSRQRIRATIHSVLKADERHLANAEIRSA